MADRDYPPQRATDRCGAVEGLIHECRLESFGRWLIASPTPFETRPVHRLSTEISWGGAASSVVKTNNRSYGADGLKKVKRSTII